MESPAASVESKLVQTWGKKKQKLYHDTAIPVMRNFGSDLLEGVFPWQGNTFKVEKKLLESLKEVVGHYLEKQRKPS